MFRSIRTNWKTLLYLASITALYVNTFGQQAEAASLPTVFKMSNMLQNYVKDYAKSPGFMMMSPSHEQDETLYCITTADAGKTQQLAFVAQSGSNFEPAGSFLRSKGCPLEGSNADIAKCLQLGTGFFHKEKNKLLVEKVSFNTYCLDQPEEQASSLRAEL